MQIKNIDPLTTKEELVEDLRREYEMKSGESIDVRALGMASWGTQVVVVVVVLPASAVPREEGAGRFRTGLTIASAGMLPDVQRCYKCHMLRHTAARCGMCCKHEGMNVRHVTGSLACPMVRMEGRSRRR